MNVRIFIFSIMISFIALYSGTGLDSDGIEAKGINVTAIASDRSFSNLERKILDSFKSALKNIGLYDNESPLYEILLSFRELNDSETIVSATLLQPASEKMIALGKKNQVFYSAFDVKKKKVKKVNKEIREYVSGEYVKQLRTVLNGSIYILSNKNPEKEAQRIIAEIMKNPVLKNLR